MRGEDYKQVDLNHYFTVLFSSHMTHRADIVVGGRGENGMWEGYIGGGEVKSSTLDNVFVRSLLELDNLQL